MGLCGGCGNPVIDGTCACPGVVEDLKAENAKLLLQIDELKREVQAEDEAKQGAREQRDNLQYQNDSMRELLFQYQSSIHLKEHLLTTKMPLEKCPIEPCPKTTKQLMLTEKRKHEGD